MNWLSLFTAVAWVDFLVIVLSKFVHLTNALDTWYKDFGLVAVGSDILIIVLGIALAQLLYPGISGIPLVTVAIIIQLIHDIAFYFLVIRGVPEGQNRIIDLFKRYSAQGSWKILLADAAMVGGSVLLMEALDNNLADDQIGFLGVLATYALLYILYTK